MTAHRITTEWPKDGSPLRAWACTDPDKHDAGGCKDFGPFAYQRRSMPVFETLTAQGHGVTQAIGDDGKPQFAAESRRSLEAHAKATLAQMCEQWALDEDARRAAEARLLDVGDGG